MNVLLYIEIYYTDYEKSMRKPQYSKCHVGAAILCLYRKLKYRFIRALKVKRKIYRRTL